jgi:DNA-binding transcriptional ArsR family regulator
MSDRPDIASIASLIGDRARAAILVSLMGGRSLTATELARAAEVSKQTASSHLGKLGRAGLVVGERVGRHHYFRLGDHEVAEVIERLMAVAERAGAARVETGPADPAVRRARVCYDHLAGEFGVMVFDGLLARGYLDLNERGLTDSGERFCEEMGINLAVLMRRRRPLCLACLDWSVRRPHLAGAVGAALLTRFVELGWCFRQKKSRVVTVSAVGERALRAKFEGRTGPQLRHAVVGANA